MDTQYLLALWRILSSSVKSYQAYLQRSSTKNFYKSKSWAPTRIRSKRIKRHLWWRNDYPSDWDIRAW
jgi:hypothetical protein